MGQDISTMAEDQYGRYGHGILMDGHRGPLGRGGPHRRRHLSARARRRARIAGRGGPWAGSGPPGHAGDGLHQAAGCALHAAQLPRPAGGEAGRAYAHRRRPSFTRYDVFAGVAVGHVWPCQPARGPQCPRLAVLLRPPVHAGRDGRFPKAVGPSRVRHDPKDATREPRVGTPEPAASAHSRRRRQPPKQPCRHRGRCGQLGGTPAHPSTRWPPRPPCSAGPRRLPCRRSSTPCSTTRCTRR